MAKIKILIFCKKCKCMRTASLIGADGKELLFMCEKLCEIRYEPKK